MKATHKLVAGLTVMGLAVSVAFAARPMPRKVAKDASEPATGVAAAAAGFNYATGFESTDAPAYTTTGYINNGAGVFPAGCGGAANPCWGHTTVTTCGGAGGVGCPGSVFTPSTVTPTIDTVSPAAGTQHLRLTYDPATRTNTPDFGLGVDARFPRTADLSARPISPNTVTIDMQITSPFGQDFRVQPQSNSQGFLATVGLFFYTGTIYVASDICGASSFGFYATGASWDTTGGYKSYSVEMNPCGLPSVSGLAPNTLNYYYDGLLIFATCPPAGTNLEQFLVFGDNFPGSDIHVDNLVMEADDVCPSVCGNGLLEAPPEQCEPGTAFGCNPGHTCGAVGAADQCMCSRTCTLAEPCILANGQNGPFYGPFDALYGGIFLYAAPTGVEAVSVELCGSTGADQRIFFWGSAGGAACPDGTPCGTDADCTPSDPGSCAYDPGNANDDCYPGYSGADPTASCYGTVTGPNYESCTCWDIPEQYDPLFLLQIRPPSGAGFSMIEINKKSECFAVGGHLGACCDTNGADTGCTDNVVQANCTGADKVWTENGKCASTQCSCIPDCTGATCGDDGCGGSCGTCGDGDVCNGEETCNANRTCDAGTPLNCNDGNACNGVETCDPLAGCRPGMPLNCDNGVACDGVESCNPSSGCVAGTAVNCDDGVDCTVDACVEPDGSCTHDDADCSIPTVSEWGLVVLALMLLIGAKVYFGRRQAIA